MVFREPIFTDCRPRIPKGKSGYCSRNTTSPITGDVYAETQAEKVSRS